MRHYNLAGGTINAASYYDGAVSNEIRHATDRSVHFVLDNYEDLSFSLYLNDPMAAVVKPLTSVIKLWRSIYTDTGTLVYTDPADTPAFSGYVAYTGKRGAANQMQVRVFCPLWRLKTRFHVNNHYLAINEDTSLPYTESELIWKFIDLLQNAFPTNNRSYMGMEKGNFQWANDPEMGPTFQAKGANGWSNIFDTILSRAESPELIPRYYHTGGSPIQMYLDTDKARGSDKTGSVSFNYHTGTNDNLDDLTEDIEINPNEFANYLWAVGHGGPNSGKLALALNVNDDEFGYDTVKVYQQYAEFNDVQLYNDTLIDMALGELKKNKKPVPTYGISISPAISSPFYGQDYVCGDAVSLNANKGALLVSNAPTRIFECTLSMSENNVETSNPLLGPDVKERIIPS
jgi:hypothetical protein